MNYSSAGIAVEDALKEKLQWLEQESTLKGKELENLRAEITSKEYSKYQDGTYEMVRDRMAEDSLESLLKEYKKEFWNTLDILCSIECSRIGIREKINEHFEAKAAEVITEAQAKASRMRESYLMREHERDCWEEMKNWPVVGKST